MTGARATSCGPILGHVVREPLGLVGLVIVSLIVLSAVFADWIVPYDPIALNIKDRLQGPSAAHWLGADQLGRDTLSRVIMGGRVALAGRPADHRRRDQTIGLTARHDGRLRAALARQPDHLLFDTIRSFPTVMFALAVVALVGPSLETVIVVIMLTSIPTYGRVVAHPDPVSSRTASSSGRKLHGRLGCRAS